MAGTTTSPATITVDRIRDIQARLGVALLESKLPDGPVQQVITLHGDDLLEEMIAPLRRRVEAMLAPAESPLDFIIRVDRSVRPAYPDGVKDVLRPELECTGPAEYDLQTQVEEWLHDGQKDGRVTGQAIYDRLEASNELTLHLGLADLLAIQQKGIAVFRTLFAGKVVFGWKSVVRNRRGYVGVPCLYGDGGEVILYWDWLGSGWSLGSPALRFRK